MRKSHRRTDSNDDFAAFRDAAAFAAHLPDAVDAHGHDRHVEIFGEQPDARLKFVHLAGFGVVAAVTRDDVRKSLNVQASKFGVQIVDVRIKKTDLPDGAPLQSAFESMRTARLQEARSIRAQGAKQAQIIRAQADADAAKTYAASFGKDPDFYDFYRAMQSYLTTFVGDGQDKPAPTNIILSPQNDYLKEFTGHTK